MDWKSGMTLLTDDALEFSRKHLSTFYDSDFFPRSFVFDAFWHCWDEVKAALLAKNISKISVGPIRTLAAIKPDRSFRIVHQLDPLDAIVYTAIAFMAAPDIESARVPTKAKVACSYRIAIHEGTLFKGGSGFTDFSQAILALSKKHKFVLLTDIADFFNQIYLHRVQNAIEAANSTLKGLSEDTEVFLMALRGKSSQGIPVGPSASIVLSEAILADIDTFLLSQGFTHTRYVDDFRIFGGNVESLERALESLTNYLYSEHLLSLSSEKTRIMRSTDHVKAFLESTRATEKLALLKSLEAFNPYSMESDELELSDEDAKELLAANLQVATKYIFNRPSLDLAVARKVLRVARRHQIPDIATAILKNINQLAPVMNDVVLYLLACSDAEFIGLHRKRIIKAVLSSSYHGAVSKLWLDWYIAQLPSLHTDPKVSSYIYTSASIENQALAAVSSRKTAWIKAKKAEVLTVGTWDRRAIIRAAALLPSGQRNPWLQHVINNAPTATDRWLARWVRETA